jgi:glycosyltransferase involved in cell wall biosynthesis
LSLTRPAGLGRVGGDVDDETRPLRVAVDGTSLLGCRTGIGHMIAELLGTLAARPDVETVTFAVTWRGRKELARMVPAGSSAAAAPVPARLARVVWAHTDALRAERWTGAVDVVHAPNFVAPPAHAPVVLTIHDLTFARSPELCTADVLGYPRLIRRALGRGATVHVVSDSVGAEVRAEFDLPPERVVRVYAGLRPTEGGDAAAGHRLAGGQHYVLALGTVEPRKNLPRLVAAFDAVASTERDVRLVVAGPDGWGSDDLATACGSARHRNRIRRLGYLSEHDRRDLVAGAAVFAYPSLYEGFGHPPLEAMAAGIPVVAGRAGALPEVLGDGALLVDPLDESELAAALATVLADDARRRELVARGRDRAVRYSWERAGDEFVALYRRLHATAVTT